MTEFSLHYPQSENGKMMLMFGSLIGGLLISSLSSDQTIRTYGGFGAWGLFMVFIAAHGLSIRLKVADFRALLDTCYDLEGRPHSQQLLIKSMTYMGTWNIGGGDWWGYDVEVEPHKEKWMKIEEADFGQISRHFFLIPEREDHFFEFKPALDAVQHDGEGPFNHNAFEMSTSQLSALPFRPFGKSDIPIQMFIMGSKLQPKMIERWDSELAELNSEEVRKAVEAMEANEGIVVYQNQDKEHRNV